MTPEEILRSFSTDAMTQIASQIKTDPTFIMDRFFKIKKQCLGDSVKIYIKRGAGVVLASLSPNAEHYMQKTDEAYILNVALPRFPLQNYLTASDINQFKSLDNKNNALTKSVSAKIAEILSAQKSSIITTFEFMAVGALFGKVFDGAGKLLFDFTSQSKPVSFFSADTTSIRKSLNEIEKAITNEFGSNPGYSVLCGYEFFDKLSEKVKSEKLEENNIAVWKNVNGKSVLEVYGIEFIPYSATYKDTKGKVQEFLESSKAIAVPNSKDIFEFHYGRANHIEAVSRAPELIFSAAPEALPKGQGYAIITESRAIPICNRPDAIIKLEFK